jgi:hypothetical protein
LTNAPTITSVAVRFCRLCQENLITSSFPSRKVTLEALRRLGKI